MTAQRLKIQRFCDSLSQLLKDECKILLDEGHSPTESLQRIHWIKDEVARVPDEDVPAVAERLREFVNWMRDVGIITAERWQKYLADGQL